MVHARPPHTAASDLSRSGTAACRPTCGRPALVHFAMGPYFTSSCGRSLADTEFARRHWRASIIGMGCPLAHNNLRRHEIPAMGRDFDGERQIAIDGIGAHRSSLTALPVAGPAAQIAIRPHRANAMVPIKRAFWRVDRNSNPLGSNRQSGSAIVGDKAIKCSARNHRIKSPPRHRLGRPVLANSRSLSRKDASIAGIKSVTASFRPSVSAHSAA